ncbi:MAG: hypothetical protein LKI88_00215 [Bifidobacterium sp.]|jgi:hypothetical protein|nr:hypothetical protein [Bifidobacterium sp.]
MQRIQGKPSNADTRSVDSFASHRRIMRTQRQEPVLVREPEAMQSFQVGIHPLS